MLSVIDAKYSDDYRIEVKFSDEREGVIDLEPFITRGNIKPFRELGDKEKFKNFKVDYTIKWDNELDLAPEYLYFEAFKNERELNDLFRRWGYR